MSNISKLPGERKCQRMVFKLAFGKNNCPRCSGKVTQMQAYFWCRECRIKIRPKAVTWFKGSKLPYRQIMALIICWFKNVPPGSVEATLGISYTTTARWYSRFRQHLPRDESILSGIVEADEAFFGRKKFHNQTIVMGAIERNEDKSLRKIKLAIIPDREQDSLELFLTKHVARSSLINTDAHAGYFGLEWNGYDHLIHNHAEGHFGGTALSENIWSTSKRQQRRMYTRIITKRLPELLNEWEGRRNLPHLFKDPFTYLEATLTPCSVLVD